MRRGVRSALFRLPGGMGYRLAGALRVREAPANALAPGTAPADFSSRTNGSDVAPLTVELEGEGRSKRLRVRASGDIWSEDFRQELARDRRFEATLVWKEFLILVFIAIVLVARTVLG
jgi:hypothetical protein